MQEYSAGFTKERLLKNEMRICVELEKEGYTRDEIKDKIIEENLFQMRANAAIKETLGMTLRRLDYLDDLLKNILLNGSMIDSLAIVLYSFLCAYRFPREFVLEVLRYNYMVANKNKLLPSEITAFFERKEEQNPRIENWSTETKKKLRSVIIRLLNESKLLEPEKDKWLITPLPVSEELRLYAEEHNTNLLMLTLIK